jgi:[ribosomal protein S5]-alanine N-acetyltransferase
MICRTARLRLREIDAGDAPFIVTLLNDAAFLENIGDRGVRSVADAAAYIERGPRASYAAHGFGLWLVELAELGELAGAATPIGICGILKRDALPEPDLGFAFLPAYRSQGYAFEAARRVCDFAREVTRLPRLLAIVNPANTPSIRLLGRLGFSIERSMIMPGETREVNLFAVTLC